jgi:DMSO reductase family type II enzyme chaperone
MRKKRVGSLDHVSLAVSTLQARALLYRVLSECFSYPSEHGWETFKVFRVESLLAAAKSLSEGWGVQWRKLMALALETDRTQMAVEYNRLFAPQQSLRCPPYETVYTCVVSSAVRHSQELADISGFYRAFGVGVSDHAADRPDHLALELEFLSLLCQKEAHALAREQTENAQICCEAQTKFLSDHLGCWAELFAKSLVTETRMEFYSVLAELLDEFIGFEKRRLSVQASKVAQRPHLAASDDRDMCGGCVIAEGKPVGQE